MSLLRVLLIDDQPIIGEAVRQMLEGCDDLELRCEHRPEQALATARACDPSVILLDLQMEPIDGLQLLDRLRAESGLGDVAIVMLSSAEEPEVKVDAFRRGANDYLVKLPSALELIARVRYHARACLASRERELAFRSLLQSQAALAARNAEIEEQKKRLERLNLELAESALTDPLTGLRNRRFLRRLLGREGDLSGRDEGSPLAAEGPVLLLMFDLDHFKLVNDRHGHDAGDAVLVEVARRLGQTFEDAVAILRWGGEEMLLVLRGAGIDAAELQAHRLMHSIAAAPVQVPGGDALPIRLSLGVAPWPWGESRKTFDQVLTVADLAVYLAKREGRNRAVLVFPGSHGQVDQVDDPDDLLAADESQLELRRLSGPG